MENNTDPSNPRSLPVLRAMIDEVDRDIVQRLADRNRIVTEIAQTKRAHQTPIRDTQREREIIRDRRAWAQSLGLSPELIEGVYRLTLYGSRDRQASLKAELPLDIESKNVAIIGGEGRMGRCMAQFFGELGQTVMIADLHTPLTPQHAVEKADVIIISVPIDETLSVIRSLGPHVRPTAVMMDVTSIKAEPMQAMLDSCTASVVGTHPLFGPTVHSLQGQRVVLCRGRGDDWFDWTKKMFHARGLVTLEASPAQHDRAMSIVQVLTHFSTEVLGMTLDSMEVDIEETLSFTSPIYLMDLLMTARHFAQSPDLYAAIQMGNPRTAEVVEAFSKAVDHVKHLVTVKDKEAFAEMFDRVRSRFGPFTDQAIEQSSFLIDRLVERTLGSA